MNAGPDDDASLPTLSAAEERILLVSADAVDAALAALTDAAIRDAPQHRLIVLRWPRLPQQSLLIEQILDELAAAAKAFWPEWIAPQSQAAASPVEQPAALGRSLLPAWLQMADAACRSGQLPRRPKSFTPQTEVRQLMLALGDRDCRILLAVDDHAPPPAAVNGFARMVEWLAIETAAPITVVLSDTAAQLPQFDSINFRMVPWSAPQLPPMDRSSAAELKLSGHAATNADAGVARPKSESAPKQFIYPLVGRPHPNSEGEALLWKRLQRDAELAPLYLCNQFFVTKLGSQYLVDFIWPSGKLVVEVDGYYWHTLPIAFSRDRQRDYELVLSGCRVLRLPHDEVLADVDDCLEKIRILTRFLQTGATPIASRK